MSTYHVSFLSVTIKVKIEIVSLAVLFFHHQSIKRTEFKPNKNQQMEVLLGAPGTRWQKSVLDENHLASQVQPLEGSVIDDTADPCLNKPVIFEFDFYEQQY